MVNFDDLLPRLALRENFYVEKVESPPLVNNYYEVKTEKYTFQINCPNFLKFFLALTPDSQLSMAEFFSQKISNGEETFVRKRTDLIEIFPNDSAAAIGGIEWYLIRCERISESTFKFSG